MEKMDINADFDSPHHLEYDLLIDHVVQEDHELLFLDTYLREMFYEEKTPSETPAVETI